MAVETAVAHHDGTKSYEGAGAVLVVVALKLILTHLERVVESLFFDSGRGLFKGRLRGVEGGAEATAGIDLVGVVGDGVLSASRR